MSHFYKQKTIYIIGGSCGIGFSTACELVNRDAHITILARREDVLKNAVEKIKTLSPNANIQHQTIDVTDESITQQQLNALIDSTGAPDIVIHCAGAAYPNYFEHISAEQFEQTLRLNIMGPRNVAAAVLPHFKSQGHGHLIFTSSIAGFVSTFGYTDYCASKFGLVGFAGALRQEVEPLNICISVLYPPDTETEGFATEEQTKPPETRAVSAANTLVQPEVVARALVKQLPKQRFHIFPLWEGYFTSLLQRLCPWLVHGFMMRTIRKTQKNIL